MERKYSLILTSMIICVLVGSLFIYSTVQAQEAGEYDPWMDTNDDGKIDMRDIGPLCRAFGAIGEPINKTELLLELLEKIENLTARVETVENQSLPEGFVAPPAYDSGWVEVGAGQTITLNHDLETKEVLVYLTGNDSSREVHQWNYGTWVDPETGNDLGAMWHSLSATQIEVYRAEAGDNWEQIRVQIWKIQEP